MQERHQQEQQWVNSAWTANTKGDGTQATKPPATTNEHLLYDLARLTWRLRTARLTPACERTPPVPTSSEESCPTRLATLAPRGDTTRAACAQLTSRPRIPTPTWTCALGWRSWNPLSSSPAERKEQRGDRGRRNEGTRFERFHLDGKRIALPFHGCSQAQRTHPRSETKERSRAQDAFAIWYCVVTWRARCGPPRDWKATHALIAYHHAGLVQDSQYCMLAEAGAVRPPNELVTNSQYLRLELDRIVGDEPAACKKRQKESGEPDDHQISEKVWCWKRRWGFLGCAVLLSVSLRSQAYSSQVR